MDLNKTQQFFQQAIPRLTTKAAVIQLSVVLEEVTELLETFSINTELGDNYLNDSITNLSRLIRSMRKDPSSVSLDRVSRVSRLDAYCDIAVTVQGAAYCEGMDFIGAKDEVDNSNLSKFDEEGIAIFDEYGKIIKGPNFFKPELEKFT